jgi:beta-lactamase class A
MILSGGLLGRAVLGVLALAGAVATPLHPSRADESANVAAAFDRTFGTRPRTPLTYDAAFQQKIASLADASQGRIGVAAMDLTSGQMVQVMGDQPFPLASTVKIAIAATFLEGVDKGRFSLQDKFPLMVPLPSRKFDGPVAPVRAGAQLTADRLIDLALTRSNNQAADALLAAVGGPRAVNAWLRRAGIYDIHMDRDIATLVRDDGAVDPATTVTTRDVTTPLAMVQLLAGIYQGKWLSASSREYLLDTMRRCVTGRHRIPAMLPDNAQVAHKTGTLFDTSSDVGLIEAPDGHVVAVAIYVTGQGAHPARDNRIATIAEAVYDGYLAQPAGQTHFAESR